MTARKGNLALEEVKGNKVQRIKLDKKIKVFEKEAHNLPLETEEKGFQTMSKTSAL